MSMPSPSHPRVPRGSPIAGRYELLVIERASLFIDDLGSDLDRLLASEPRATERLRLLRETTNRITRTANDAIQAYAKARRVIDAQLERADGNHELLLATRARLRSARQDLLRAISTANRRYPSEPDEPGPGLAASPIQGDAISGR
ncbi:MAG TPA: hypothetical protein VF013_06945 [Candidatus Limnocylindria bacterium]